MKKEVLDKMKKFFGKYFKKLTYVFFKPLYTLLALSLVFFTYAVNNDLTLDSVARKFEWTCFSQWLETNIPSYCSYILYVSILIGLAFLLQCASKFLPNIDMPKGNITSIEPASDGMMITYFGLFFFALSVNNAQALMITFILLFVCLLFSNVYMFNPLFSITQYKFYYITFKSGKKCLLMSKEKFAYGDSVEFTQLYKLNEFTFID
jgi:hypothetical protein